MSSPITRAPRVAGASVCRQCEPPAGPVELVPVTTSRDGLEWWYCTSCGAVSPRGVHPPSHPSRSSFVIPEPRPRPPARREPDPWGERIPGTFKSHHTLRPGSWIPQAHADVEVDLEAPVEPVDPNVEALLEATLEPLVEQRRRRRR